MKRSHAYWLAVLAFVALGFAIGIPWVVICLVNEGRILPNGAWILVIVCFALAIANIVQARRAELEEEREERYASLSRDEGDDDDDV